MKSLYISYLSIEDPLVRTQVVSYLRVLAQNDIKIFLLTFEPKMPSSEHRKKITALLAKQGIKWNCLRYHKRPSLPATLWDIFIGTIFSFILVKRYQVDVIHARTHVPAAMALILKKITGAKMLFDVRGLMADEYVDAGIWKKTSINFKLVKYMEQIFFDKADVIVVLTERIKKILYNKGKLKLSSTQVIPSCVDIERFQVEPQSMIKRRAALGLEHKTVLIYIGKFGSWYLLDQMIDFFKIARQIISNLHFLLLTQSEHEIAHNAFERHNVSLVDYTVTTVTVEEMPQNLLMADAAISFIQPCFSKIASSPTKIGEYLAAGLPIISNTGIGDCDVLLKNQGVGILIDHFDEKSYQLAAVQLAALLVEREKVRERCQERAQEELSLQNVGTKRYREVYSRLGNN